MKKTKLIKMMGSLSAFSAVVAIPVIAVEQIQTNQAIAKKDLKDCFTGASSGTLDWGAQAIQPTAATLKSYLFTIATSGNTPVINDLTITDNSPATSFTVGVVATSYEYTGTITVTYTLTGQKALSTDLVTTACDMSTTVSWNQNPTVTQYLRALKSMTNNSNLNINAVTVSLDGGSTQLAWSDQIPLDQDGLWDTTNQNYAFSVVPKAGTTVYVSTGVVNTTLVVKRDTLTEIFTANYTLSHEFTVNPSGHQMITWLKNEKATEWAEHGLNDQNDYLSYSNPTGTDLSVTALTGNRTLDPTSSVIHILFTLTAKVALVDVMKNTGGTAIESLPPFNQEPIAQDIIDACNAVLQTETPVDWTQITISFSGTQPNRKAILTPITASVIYTSTAYEIGITIAA